LPQLLLKGKVPREESLFCGGREENGLPHPWTGRKGAMGSSAAGGCSPWREGAGNSNYGQGKWRSAMGGREENLLVVAAVRAIELNGGRCRELGLEPWKIPAHVQEQREETVGKKVEDAAAGMPSAGSRGPAMGEDQRPGRK
jgi:hypothetical protein